MNLVPSSDRHGLDAGTIRIDRRGEDGEVYSETAAGDLITADRSLGVGDDGGRGLDDRIRASTQAFCRTPAAYIHADRFPECIPDIPAPLAIRLLGCARLQRQLSQLIVEHYHLEECTKANFMDATSRFCLLDAEQLRRVGELAGGIWYARLLRSIVFGRALATILADFAPQLHGVALENVDLSPEPERSLDPAALGEAIRRDGMHCLGAFVARLPAPLRRRVLLKFPDGSPVGSLVSEPHAALGPVIIDRTAARGLIP